MRAPWCSRRCSEAATRKPGRAAGRIADDGLRGGRGHVHHQPDDVARRAKLPVLPGGGDLAEHVLVEVALGVAVGHVDVVELVDDVGQHAGRGHHEEGVLHVMGVRRSLVGAPRLTDGLDEGEHAVAHRLEHPLRRKLLEARPPQRVLAGVEQRLLDRAAGAGGPVLFAGVQLVEALDEEQVGELLDDRERVRDAAGPHGVPDSVDLGLQLAGDHDSPSRLASPRPAWTLAARGRSLSAAGILMSRPVIGPASSPSTAPRPSPSSSMAGSAPERPRVGALAVLRDLPSDRNRSTPHSDHGMSSEMPARALRPAGERPQRVGQFHPGRRPTPASHRRGGRRGCHGAPATSAPVDHASRTGWGADGAAPIGPAGHGRRPATRNRAATARSGADSQGCPLRGVRPRRWRCGCRARNGWPISAPGAGSVEDASELAAAVGGGASPPPGVDAQASPGQRGGTRRSRAARRGEDLCV